MPFLTRPKNGQVKSENIEPCPVKLPNERNLIMKKVIICNIPMKESVDQVVYTSDDRSLRISDRRVRYPVNALLEKTVSSGDEIKVILLSKNDEYSFSQQHTNEFIDELYQALASSDVKPVIKIIDTEFSQDRLVHEQLMGKLVEEIDEEAHVLVDITYGPKDLPIVIFAAIGFAEKFLECEIDAIVYGQASFVQGKAVNQKICDMSPLYYLSSVTNTICCDKPEKARKTLNELLSL